MARNYFRRIFPFSITHNDEKASSVYDAGADDVTTKPKNACLVSFPIVFGMLNRMATRLQLLVISHILDDWPVLREAPGQLTCFFF